MENEEFQKLVLGYFERIDKRFDGIAGKLSEHDQKFDSLSSQVQENTRILKALEHIAEVNKAEHDSSLFN